MPKVKKDPKETKKDPKETPVKKGFVEMYWPHSSNNEFGVSNVFGHSAKQNENGHMVVLVPEKCVKNEKKRLSPMMDKEQYEAFLILNKSEEE